MSDQQRVELARQYGKDHDADDEAELLIRMFEHGRSPQKRVPGPVIAAILHGEIVLAPALPSGFVAEKLQEHVRLDEYPDSFDLGWNAALKAVAEALGLQEDGDQPEGDHCTCWHHEGRRTGWDEDSPCALHPDDGPRGKDGRDG